MRPSLAPGRPTSPAAHAGLTPAPSGAARAAVAAGLLLGEIAAVSYLFYFPTPLGEWSNPVFYVKKLVQFAVLAVAMFGLAAWPRRAEILGRWTAANAGARRWYPPVLANLGLFAAVVVATAAFSSLVAAAAQPPWGWFWAYCALLAANALSLVFVAAPLRFWVGLPRWAPVELVLAFGGAAVVLFAGEAAKESWGALSWATLQAAATILSLYEPGVLVDPDLRLLGIGSFRVIIAPECSGYEGIGLVAAALSLYLWMFRDRLKFPHALLLIPAGVAAIWLFNAVRIAALVSIGAHLSPAVAAGGFHSQAGWIGFLAATAGLMIAAQRVRLFTGQARPAKGACSPGDRQLHALLIPFIALLGAGIVIAAFAPHGQWLYGLKVVAIGAALWVWRDVYLAMDRRVSGVAVLAGLTVGIAWAATDPAAGQQSAAGAWLQALPPAFAVLWIALHLIGSVILVPAAEELAFRGYLYGALIARRFESVPLDQFAWRALIVSSVLFGLMHQRWLAGAAAGAVYALLMVRSGRLSDPIAAHMASNLVIVAWAVALGQWSLL